MAKRVSTRNDARPRKYLSGCVINADLAAATRMYNTIQFARNVISEVTTKFRAKKDDWIIGVFQRCEICVVHGLCWRTLKLTLFCNNWWYASGVGTLKKVRMCAVDSTIFIRTGNGAKWFP